MWKNKFQAFGTLLALAGPIYAGLLAQNIIGIADTAMLGSYGALEQQAGGYGALCILVVYVVGFGFALGLQIRMGQAFGAAKPQKALEYFRQGMRLLALYAALWFCFFAFASYPILYALTNNAALARATSEYLLWRSPGVLCSLPSLGFYALAVSSNDSKPVGLAYVLGALLNVSLDYFLIFGVGVFSELGIRGAGLASAIADFGVLALYVLYFVQINKKHKGLFKGRYDGNLTPLFTTAAPLVLQNALSMASWFAFFTLIERTGALNFQLSIILRSIYGVFMIGGIALGAACNSLVSQAVGAGNWSKIPGILKKGSLLALFLSVGTGWLMPVFSTAITGLFTPSDALIRMSTPSLWVIYLGLIGFSIGQIWFNGLSGTGKTIRALWAEGICLVLYVGYTALLVVFSDSPKSEVIWIAEWIYGFGLLLCSFVFLHYLLKRRNPEPLNSLS